MTLNQGRPQWSQANTLRSISSTLWISSRPGTHCPDWAWSHLLCCAWWSLSLHLSPLTAIMSDYISTKLGMHCALNFHVFFLSLQAITFQRLAIVLVAMYLLWMSLFVSRWEEDWCCIFVMQHWDVMLDDGREATPSNPFMKVSKPQGRRMWQRLKNMTMYSCLLVSRGWAQCHSHIQSLSPETPLCCEPNHVSP